MNMALPTNDDFSNCALSIEELEVIAAGSLLGDLWNDVKHAASVVVHDIGVAINWIEHHYEGRPQGGPYGSSLRAK